MLKHNVVVFPVPLRGSTHTIKLKEYTNVLFVELLYSSEYAKYSFEILSLKLCVILYIFQI